MRGSAARALLPAAIVLALVAVVAIAAGGSTSRGTSGLRPPSATLLDTILSLGFVAVLAGAALLIYGLTQRKAIRREIASGRYPRTPLWAFLAFMSLFTVVTYWRFEEWKLVPEEPADEQAFPGGVITPVPPDSGATEVTYRPSFAWLPVLVVVGLAAAAVAAHVVAQRRSDRAISDEALAEDFAAIIDDTLADLRAESDPRRAIIAAYARLERVLAAHGTPRRAAETPGEYLRRVLAELEIDANAARRLTDLFTRAKFSQHAVDSGMKEEAIEALEQVRDGLRTAAATREEANGLERGAIEASA